MNRHTPLWWAVGAALLVSLSGTDAHARKRRATTPEAEAPANTADCRQVSLFGTSLRLGTVLDQLARNQGLRLIIRSDVTAKQEVDIPTLKNVCLEEALRVILTPAGYAFDIRDGELIVFARYVRVYRVNVPMIKQEYLTQLSNEGSSSGGGGGGAAQEGVGASGGAASLGATLSLVTTSSSEGLWAELEIAIKTLVSKDGTYSINRSAGLVTVRDKAYALDAVERYVDAINTEMARQAVIEVRVAEVTLDDTAQAGIDWGVVFDGISNVTLTSASLSAQNLIAVQPDANPVSFGIRGVNANLILRALETQGEVETVSQPNLVVGNNLPAILQAGKMRAYVRSIAVQASGVAGQIGITVETGVLSDGIIMTLLPRINDDGTVRLAVSVLLQEILSIESRVFEGNAVELPTVNRRSYSGVVTGKLGETMIIAGLIDDREEDKTLGVPILSRIPILGILFGGQEYNKRRTELVILLSPRSPSSARPTAEDLERFPDPRD